MTKATYTSVYVGLTVSESVSFRVFTAILAGSVAADRQAGIDARVVA